MTKTSTNYVCQQCGYVSPSFLGRCPNCEAWGSLVETIESRSGNQEIRKSVGSQKPIKLSEIKAEASRRTPTGISELDLVLGGGVVPGMAVLLAGEPGIGKSTLLLELAKNITGAVLYVAGEESASQIKIRAQRLGIKADNILIFEQTDVDLLRSLLDTQGETLRNGLVIVDSIQTLTTDDLTGTAGSVGQVRECAARLIAKTKSLGMPLFLIGHVTKDGAIAGPKVLEHIVDTVLNIEGEKSSNLRLVRTSKNRFGPTDEVGIFEMSDTGLAPTTPDLTPAMAGGQVGSCQTITMEGTRPILVEIQALTTATPLPAPRRVGNGVDYARLQMIVAVLQKRLNLPLWKEDIYVSVSGGFKISEPAVDLPIALAILSSFRNKALPAKALAIGELDLLGNVRAVNNLPRRLKEAKKLGYNNLLSTNNLKSLYDTAGQLV
ncbi:MAG: DNA repair protein RadA [Patescibacteria group bacterium]|nr:DNA repair protein RadA [Patescibacteria group bacterium]MCL5432376.1 DNA repair protein RadA [Patescibacteria group bacterium]